MNRYVVPVLILLVVIGMIASIAATTTPTSESPLAGKFVLISQPGVIHSIHKNSRFESIGQVDFIVVPMPLTGEKVTYDYWIPLKDVTLLKVFHNEADAKEYKKIDAKHEQQRQSRIEQRRIQLAPNKD